MPLWTDIIDPATLTGVLEPNMVEGEVTDLTDDGVPVGGTHF